PISQSGVRRAIGANLLARARRHGGIRRSVVDREREAAAGGNRREPCCRARVDGASPPAAAAGAAVDVAQAWTVTTSSPCWRSGTAPALSSCSRARRADRVLHGRPGGPLMNEHLGEGRPAPEPSGSPLTRADYKK